MIDQRLTAKTELTNPNNDDILYVVDVSDTTDSPEGTSKKIKISNLLKSTKSTSGTGTTVTFENPLGKFYGADTPLNGNIVLDNTGNLNGGVVVVYHMSLTEPTITGGTIISDVGTYNNDGQTLNIIFITIDVNGNYLVNRQENTFAGYPTTLETEIQNLLTQADTDGYTKVSGFKLNKLQTFIKGLKDNGIYSLLDRLYVLDTNGSADFSKYDVINPTVSGNKLTLLGTPTFTALSGWNGAATHALNTNFQPADGVNFQQDSASVIVYQKNTSTGYSCGVIKDSDTSRRAAIGFNANAADIFNALNSTNADAISHVVSDSVIHINRSNSSNFETFVNGVSIGTSTATSTVPADQDMYLLARNFSGINTPTDGTISICMIGGDLSGKEVIINSLIQNYLG